MNKRKFTAVGFGAILLSVSSLLSKVLGVLRDFVFSKIFGVGAQGGAFALDAYLAAFRIPDLLYSLLIFGAMSAAFIPIYTSLHKKSEKDASEFASKILNALLFLLILVSILAWIFAPYFVPLLAPGFEQSVLDTTIVLTRIMLISPIFLALSSVFQGIENSHKKFLGISLAPIVYNLSIVVSAFFFGNEYGVYALAWGVVVGAILHFCVQVPGILRTPFKYSFDFNFKTKEFRQFIKLTIPRIFGISVSQLGIFIDTIIASLLSLGSLSIFNYSLNLQSLPYAVVAVSFSVAVFSSLSEDASESDKNIFLKRMRSSTNTILFWVIPAIVGLFFLKRPIVELILLGGAFDDAAASMTVMTLSIFIWAALGQSLIPLFARAFYALHETKIPVLIAFFSVLINMAISLTLTQVYDFEVWALAVSALVSSTINACFLIIFLSKYLKVSFHDFFDLHGLESTILTTVLMAGVIMIMQIFEYSNVLVETLLVAGVGFSVYMLANKFNQTIPSLHER